jgi:hypothetical protein
MATQPNQEIPSEDGILSDQIRQLMTPKAIKDLDPLVKNPAVQQFLIRLLDVRDSNILKSIDTKMCDVNERICLNVAEIIANQNASMHSFFGSVEKFMEAIAHDMNDMKASMRKIDTKIDVLDRRQASFEKRLHEVEIKLEEHLKL